MLAQQRGFGMNSISKADVSKVVEITAAARAASLQLKYTLPNHNRLAEVETDVPSSDSDQGSEEDHDVASFLAERRLHFKAISQALPGKSQMRLPRDMCEIVEVTSADKSQPCWLVPRCDGIVVMQATPQQAVSASPREHRALVWAREELLQGSPPAPPPGLRVPEHLQQEVSAVVQQGGPGQKVRAVVQQCGPGQKYQGPATGPQLTCTRTATGSKVAWVVDAKRLQSKDRMFVSPVFQLQMGHPVSFRMMMQPKHMSEVKGGQSFSKAHGCGTIQLKCEEGLVGSEATLAFKLSVGSASWRGPVEHDFAGTSTAGLPTGRHVWNFRSAVDNSSQTFTVHLEVDCGVELAREE